MADPIERNPLPPGYSRREESQSQIHSAVAVGVSPSQFQAPVDSPYYTGADNLRRINAQRREFQTLMAFGKSTNPDFKVEDEIAKINTSLWLSEQMGVSAKHAYQNFGEITEAYFGVVNPPKTHWKAIQEEYKRAQISAKSSHSAFRLLRMDPESEEFTVEFDNYINLISSMPKEDDAPHPLWAKSLKAAAAFGPSVLRSSVAGAGGALISTAISGNPATGFVAGSALESFALESGGIFGDIVTAEVPLSDGRTLPLYQYMQESLPPEERGQAIRNLVKLGRTASVVGGMIAAGIELAQLDILAGGKLLQDAVGHASSKILTELATTKRLANRVAMVVAAQGGNVLENTIEEVLQETVEWTSAELVKRATEESLKIGVPRTAFEDWAENLKGVAETALLGSFVLGLPGSIVQAASIKAPEHNKVVGDASFEDGEKVVPFNLLIAPDEEAPSGEVERARSQIEAAESGQGRIAPLEVYKDEEGYHVAAGQGLYDALAERGEGAVKIRLIEKPEIDATPDVEDTAAGAFSISGVDLIVDPADVTSSEYVFSKVSESREAQSRQERLNRDLFRNKVLENLPGVSETDIDKGMALIDVFAKYRGMSSDQFLREAFTPDAVSYQERIPGNKAAVNFKDGKAKFVFTELSDFSSLVHEFSHVARQWLKPDEVTDLEMFYRARFGREGKFGVSEVQLEERFAQDFEEYLRSGKAPDFRIANLFAQIAALLKEIMDKIRGLPTVPDEVRSVLDRVFSGRGEENAVENLSQTETLFQPDLSIEEYKKDLQRAINDESDAPVRVSEHTPWVLRQLGASDKEIFFYKGKIRNVLSKHSEITQEVLEEIPEKIPNPLLISIPDPQKYQQSGFNIIIDQWTEKGPVMVSLLLDQNKDEIVIHRITSIYGRENWDATLKRWFENGMVRYVDDTKKGVISGLTEALLLNRPEKTPSERNDVSESIGEQYSKERPTSFSKESILLKSQIVKMDTLFQSVYHGTPHVWESEPGFPHGRPKLDKMGLGEGAQAYGWGWYSAESKKVAEFYARLSGGPNRQLDTAYIAAARDFIKNGLDPSIGLRKAYSDITDDEISAAIIEVKGKSLYELDIPKDVIPKLLDWDIELSEQTPFVQKALQDYKDDGASSSATGEFIYKELQKPFLSERLGYELGSNPQKSVSEYLNSLGIPGLRYLDGYSRGAEYGNPTYNYVIWDQVVLDQIALLERNGEKLEKIQEATTLYQEIKDEHEEAVRQAVELGKPVYDRVIADYAGRPWADAELQRRELLRGDFSWIIEKAREAKSPQELRTAVESDELATSNQAHSRPDDLFYKRAWQLAHTVSRAKANREFVRSLLDDTTLREFIRHLSTDPSKIRGMGIHPKVWGAVTKGSIRSIHEMAAIREIVRRRPEVYRRALARSTGDASLEEQIQAEHDIEILDVEGAILKRRPVDRLKLAAQIEDPSLRRQALSGKLTPAAVDAMAIQLKKEQTELENEIGKLTEEESKLNEQLEKAEAEIKKEKGKQKELKKAHAEEIRAHRDAKKSAIEEVKLSLKVKAKDAEAARKIARYKFDLAERIKRNIPGTVDFYVAEVIREMQDQLDPHNRKEKTIKEREAWRELLEKNPALAEIIKPDLLQIIYSRPLNLWSIAELEELADKIDHMIDVGREEKKKKDKQQRLLREEAWKNSTEEVLDGEDPPPFEPIGSKESEKQRNASVAGHIEAASWRPSRVIKYISGGREGTLYNWFVRKVDEATDETIRRVTKRHNKGKEMMAELGITEKALAREITAQGLTLSCDQVIHLQIAMYNEKSRAAVLFGNGFTEKQIFHLTEQLSKNEKKWGEFLIKEFDENYDRLRESYIEYANQDMGKEPNYFPMLRLGANFELVDKELADQLLVRNAWKSGYADKRFTKHRIEIGAEHQTAIRLGATAIWSEQVEKQEHFINSGRLITHLQAIRNNKELKESISIKYGDRFNKWLEKYVNDFASPSIYKSFDATSALMSKLRKNYALAALSFNLLTILKQIPSLTLFLAKVGPLKLMAAAGQVMTQPKKYLDFVDEKDPQMMARSMNRAMEELKSYKPGASGMVRKIAEMGMKPIAWVDKLVTTMGWMAVYNDRVSQGFSEEDAAYAAQRSILETQPAGRSKDLAEMYRSNEGLNWFLMFTNQINQIWNLISADLPLAVKQGHIKEALGIAAGVSVGFATMSLLSGWRPPEDPEDIPKEIAYQYLKQMVNTMPLVGGLISTGMSKWGDGGVNPFPLASQIGELTEFAFKDEKTEKQFVKQLENLGKALGMAVGVPTVEAARIARMVETGAETDNAVKALLELFGPAFKKEIEK